MNAFFFTTPSVQWSKVAGFFPDVSYAIVKTEGGPRRENEVKRTKECEEEKINGCEALTCVGLSRINGDETKRALPAKNEQSEHVSACDASICLQFSASAWVVMLVFPEPNAESASP